MKNTIKNYLQFAKKSNQNFKYWARNKSVCGAYKKSGNFCCVTIFENLFIQEERVRTIWEGGREGVKILHSKLQDIKWIYPLCIIINNEYLQSFNNPVAVIAPKLVSLKKQNCCIKEKSYPMLTAFTEGAKVMLLKNYIVELGLMNGSVGTVVDIVYEEAEGPRNQENLPAYVIVDFPKCLFPNAGIGYTEQAPKTNVPIPITKEFCDKKCCTIETIPLRVCKAITIHKGQGITIGVGHDWETYTLSNVKTTGN